MVLELRMREVVFPEIYVLGEVDLWLNAESMDSHDVCLEVKGSATNFQREDDWVAK